MRMDLVTCEIDEGRRIATVTVNRPEVLNALDVSTAEALRNIAGRLEARTDIRCIVFRGAGRAFIAGGDLTAMATDFSKAGEVAKALLDAMEPVVQLFQLHPAPVLASVHGAVAGAGLSLMAACDVVVAAADTRFVLGYDKIGVPPDCGGTFFLPRLVGERRAAALMYLGETWDAEQAFRYGLVTRVVRPEDLEEATQKLAQTIADGPSLAFAQYKTLVREGRGRGLTEQLEEERHAFCAATRTEDFQSGVTSFLSHKKGRFNGV